MAAALIAGLAVILCALAASRGQGPEIMAAEVPAPVPANPGGSWLSWLNGGSPPAEAFPPPIVRARFVGFQVSAWYRGENVGPRTCASRVFSRGSWLILEAGGQRVPVRVNDYGPADPATGTLLDVSPDVAALLGFKGAGHGLVGVYLVEVLP